MAGPFIDGEYATLAKSKKSYGRDNQCVALVQRDGGSGAPPTSRWRPGLRVLDAKADDILPGTVIATFWKGIYPPGGSKHAALYVAHHAAGTDDKGHPTGWIEVVDQWEQSVQQDVTDTDGTVKQKWVPQGVAPAEARQSRGGNGHIRSQPKLYVTIMEQTGANAPATRPRLSNIAEYYHVVVTD